ncbi:sulfoacetaldehyde acetyltransferase [Bacillus carboniphilus]|uniref:Sulfoacetaldehyde acetyltransferase n=1 Tax=Bacillus carboniphilus TaxID=86663 RepID=A0ABN0W5Z9_9BACI
MNVNSTVTEQNRKLLLSGGQAAVKALEVEGVEHVFGLIGSSTMEMFDALYDSKQIKYIGVRDERTGTHMADAYARATGKPGVVLAGQSGPGATNLVTGLAQAYHAFSPVVAIAGSIASNHKYRDAFQEVDQQALFTPVTKKTWTVPRADRIPEMLQEAFRVSQTGRKGPVVLNIPRDIFAEINEYSAFLTPDQYMSASAPSGDLKQVEEAIKLLSQSEKPLIIAGAGVKWSRAQKDVLELAERLNAPLATAAGHGDAVPCDHPLYAGQVGPRGNVVATNLAREADVILALGTRLGFNSTFYSYDNLNKDAKIIQVNIEPASLSRYFPVSIGIYGDVGNVTRQLLQGLGNQDSNSYVAQWTDQFHQNRNQLLDERERKGAVDANPNPIQPAQVFQALRNTLPKDAMYTLDAGTLCLQATDSLNYYQSPGLFTPLDFGLVGFSFAAGLGIKAAYPERTVVSLMGDGGFGMTMSEISTAVEAKLNTVTIVMNNHCWGAEKAYQKDFFGERYIGADVVNPRYDRVAEEFGAKGFRVEKAEDLEATIEEALKANAPAIVDVQVDPNALYSFRRDSFQHRK